MERTRQIRPPAIDGPRANRDFLQRAVTWLAAHRGIRQFLDLRSGLPAQHNTHEVVSEVWRDGRVVYVDNDPQVITDTEPLLAGLEGVALIQADIRDPASLLTHPQTRRLINFTEPVGLLMAAVTHVVPDDDPCRLVARYVDAVPSGSYLALCAGASDRHETWQSVLMRGRARGYEFDGVRAHVERFFADDGAYLAYATVARKP